MRVYQFKVSIVGIPKLYRIIEAGGNCTFDDLHKAIFEAFDRFDPHLYSFFITRSDSKSMRSIMQAPEITHPYNLEDLMGHERQKRSAAGTKIDDARLEERDFFHYLFDFGDEWWHRIRVQSVTESNARKKCLRIVKSVGESPPQYPDYDAEDSDDKDYDDE